ncbi:transporter substrate-binding domain-containing protein [Mollicutes bacterium LVI A0039]|nr:transporter substrate-binding domain-containing protein [Mollicutes bacterium LVI A0039]
MKRILRLATFALVAILGLAGCSSNGDDPLADGVLTIGMEADYAPYNWTTNADNASEYAYQISGSDALADGYDVRIAQALADELGVELEIKKMTWDGLIPAVQSGSIDGIIAGMSPTEERKQQIDFTNAYHEDNMDMVVVVNANSDYANATSLADLAGANLSAQIGTFHVDLLDQIEIADNATAPLPDFASLIQATASGSLDGYIAESTTAVVQVENNSNLKIIDVGDEFEIDPSISQSAIGVKKDTGLAEKLNDALATIDDETRVEWMAEASRLSGQE